MKKLLLAALTVMMIALLAAGCGSGSGNNGGGANQADNQKESGGSGSKEPVTLNIFQFKVEIAAAFEQMAKEYEKETGVKVKVETVGGGADYGSALKAKLAAGEEPDIFNNGGYNQLDLYMDRATDLSDQPWVANLVEAAKAPTLRDGKLYGMPMNLEGYGYIYNKDLFAKAGITELPTTLSALTEAAEKLEAAGITPFANGYGELFIIGVHLFNVAVAQQPDPDQFVEDLKNGKATMAGNELFEDWIDLLDMTLKHGNDNPLTTDYNTQVTLFASGQTAMLQQGNWTQVQIDGINPDLNLGLLPIPINDNEEMTDHIYAGVPNNWIVNSKGKHPEEAKAFLNWMVSSDTGKKYMIQDFKFIPAFTNIEGSAEDLGDIAASILEYNKQNKSLGWYFYKFPDGATDEFASATQSYIAGKLNREQLLKEFDNIVHTLVEKSQ